MFAKRVGDLAGACKGEGNDTCNDDAADALTDVADNGTCCTDSKTQDKCLIDKIFENYERVCDDTGKDQRSDGLFECSRLTNFQTSTEAIRATPVLMTSVPTHNSYSWPVYQRGMSPE